MEEKSLWQECVEAQRKDWQLKRASWKLNKGMLIRNFIVWYIAAELTITLFRELLGQNLIVFIVSLITAMVFADWIIRKWLSDDYRDPKEWDDNESKQI